MSLNIFTIFYFHEWETLLSFLFAVLIGVVHTFVKGRSKVNRKVAQLDFPDRTSCYQPMWSSVTGGGGLPVLWNRLCSQACCRGPPARLPHCEEDVCSSEWHTTSSAPCIVFSQHKLHLGCYPPTSFCVLNIFQHWSKRKNGRRR